MCGIAGIADTSYAPQKEYMRAMLNRIAHRGPDGEGIYSFGEFTLGHRRLSIIDLVSGDQPMYSADRRYVIVYNGEIYNYKDLRQQLLALGARFHTNSDTEVILNGYIHWGEEVLQRLNGIFAFAIIDTLSHRLLLARDHFGIKPLYYTVQDGLLVFASEYKAILCHPKVQPKPNYRALHDLVNLRYVLHPHTLIEGIHHLPPAHYMVWENGRYSIKRYWQLPFEIRQDMSESEAIEGIQHFTKQAVERQLVSDVPIGVYLSGGLDSSTIVAQMYALGVRPINTFTLGFNEPTDEFDDAALVAEHFHTQHRTTALTLRPLEQYPRVLWHSEVPKINILQGYNMSRFVHRYVKVVLGGLGGDEIFAGYDIHRILYRMLRWDRMLELLSPGFRNKLADIAFRLQSATNMLAWDEYRRGLQALLRLKELPRAYLILRNAWESDRAMFKKIYSPAFVEQLPPREYLLERMQSVFDKYDYLPPLEQVMAVEMHTKMVDDYLHVEDRMSMAHGVEERVPFLDIDLVKFALTIPNHLKMRDGKTKYLMRKAMQGILPEPILRKKKWGFTVNPYLQFKKDLKYVAEHILTRDRVQRQGIFNYAYIERILRARPHPRMRWHYNLLWLMVGYCIWEEQFLNDKTWKEPEWELEAYYGEGVSLA